MITMLIGVIAALALVLMIATCSWGETTGSQTLTVIVPASSEVIAPPAVTTTRQGNEDNTIFLPQRWIVGGNGNAGMAVDFSIRHAFTHVDDPTQKRDARISLSIADHVGQASWIVTQPNDTTNVRLGDEIASVQATSDTVGTVHVDLQIEFVSKSIDVLQPGEYGATVITTITMN